MDFKEKVLKIASRIPKGKFLTYKKVAWLAGKPRAYRAVANILAGNRNPKIACYRVIKNDHSVGGYFGSEKLSWQKAALFLKDGAVGVIPTDTIYGICAPALDKKAVEKVYKLRRRDLKKPMIILIGSLNDLRKFDIDLNVWQKKILNPAHKQVMCGINKVWPGKVSVVLPCAGKKFAYLHRGTKTLAFRLPKKRELLEILSISGPLVAPSANYEGEKPAKNTTQARKYFGKNVFYYGQGNLAGAPSTLIDLTQKTDKIKILRNSARK